ncbi:MAG: hypothetical protein C5B51_29045 [Terriglobia bacterium]|nr:MAG: hypothetical protein C5B51_29045 [Terriglobia bacterium]
MLWLGRVARQAASLAATVLIGGLLTTALVRNSPGFDADERQLDARLDDSTRALIQAGHAENHNVLRFYARHMRGLLHGDLGMSASLQTPIAGLIRSRYAVTAEIMAAGLAAGWILAFVLALAAVWNGACARITGVFSVAALSLPSAALAVLVFVLHGPVHSVIALVLFPRLFDYLRNLLQDAYAQPHILTARAKGLHPVRILVRHVLPGCDRQLLALAGVSASMAFGAAIPVETLGDLPGLGQLAWKAALARDLPLLVTLTMLITMLTQICNSVSDWWVRE